MWNFVRRAVRRNYGQDKEYYRIIDELFGFVPHNIELYKLALIHKSASLVLADGRQINNERLEFSRQSLNTIARTIGLDRYVIANPTGSTNQKHIYGDAFEAMIGAIYLDQGYEFANRLLINNIYYRYLNLDNLTDEETDFKSRLIEWCQKTHHTIAFETVHGRNYSSNHPIFDATVVIDGIRVGHGQGESKKEAEQCAAHSVSCAMSDEACGDILDKIDRLYRPKGTGVS